MTPFLVDPFVEATDPIGRFCDVAGLVVLAVGALFCLASAIGLTRLDGLYARMHAATKPQVLGTLLVLTGIGLRLRDPGDIALLVLIGMCQMLTIPASAQLLARAHLRSGADDTAAGATRPKDTPEPPRSAPAAGPTQSRSRR